MCEFTSDGSIHQAIFGPINLDIDILERPHDGVVIKLEFLNLLREDLKKNGLLNPLNVDWRLNQDCRKITIDRGNGRLFILKEMGWKKVSCYLKISFFESNICLLDNFKKILPFVIENDGPDNNFMVKQNKTSLDKFDKS